MEFLGVKKVQKLKKFKIVQVVTSTYSKILSTFFFVSSHFNNSSDVVRITIYDYLYLVTFGNNCEIIICRKEHVIIYLDIQTKQDMFSYANVMYTL